MFQPRLRQAHQSQCNNMHPSGLVLLVENLAPTATFVFRICGGETIGAGIVAGHVCVVARAFTSFAADPKNKEYLLVSRRATCSAKTVVGSVEPLKRPIWLLIKPLFLPRLNRKGAFL